MVQPKNILFGTGAPLMVVSALDVDGVPTLPIDDWTHILDLREDPDQKLVRRITLWAHWNYVEAPDPPERDAAIVSVIDDTITDPLEALLRPVAMAAIPLGD